MLVVLRVFFAMDKLCGLLPKNQGVYTDKRRSLLIGYLTVENQNLLQPFPRDFVRRAPPSCRGSSGDVIFLW